jgi:hypothetical protein
MSLAAGLSCEGQAILTNNNVDLRFEKPGNECREVVELNAGDGNRTHTPLAGPRILRGNDQFHVHG